MGHTRRAVTQVATNSSPVCSEECLYIWSTRVARKLEEAYFPWRCML